MLRKLSTASLLYLVLGLASFYPQSLRPRDTVAYVGDSLESVYIVAWNVHQFFRAPANLFDANVLHPHAQALTFTDHRLLPSLAVAPVVWATGNPVLAYNVAVLLACLLAAWAARRLALALGAGETAAWAAGALYAFNTYQLNEAPRLNIVSHGFIPLALEQLVRFLKGGERRHAWGLAACLLLQGLSSNYHLLYGLLLSGIVTAAALVAQPALVARRLPALAAPALVAALLFAPLAIPYLRASRAQGFERELPVGVDLRHYVSTPASNLLYGHIGAEVRLQQRGPHFVGFVSLALALAAVLAWARRRGPADPPQALLPARIWVPAAAALALLFVALSLGRDAVAFGKSLGPGPYRLLWAIVPGFKLVRIPERLGLVAMLFVAMLAARGLDLARHAGFPRLAVLLLALLVPLEHLAPPPGERVPVTRNLPQVYRWLDQSAAGAIGEAPARSEGLVRQETLEMYFSTVHFKRTIHGYTAYPPLLTVLLRRMLAEFPSDLSLQALTRVGVDTVIVHHGRPWAVDLARQLEDTVRDPAERAERFRRLARASRLDVFDRLPEAVATGRLELLARFVGAEARLFESEGDEAYRLFPVRRFVPAPFPGGRRASSAAWRYRAKSGDPRLAFDGDPSTCWKVQRPLLGDELLEVTFDQPLRVSGVRLPLRRDSAFPTRFRLAALTPERHWVEAARFDEAHALQLLEALLADPKTAALGFDLGGRECLGLSLLVEEGGTSFEGWSVPELEVLSEAPSSLAKPRHPERSEGSGHGYDQILWADALGWRPSG